MERLDKNGKPTGWDMAYNKPGKQYKITLDSVTKRQGKYAVSITYDTGKVSFGAINFPIKRSLRGKDLILAAWIKTENVSGYAGLFMISKANGSDLEFADMKDQNLNGTHDWKEYYIRMPNNQKALGLDAGAFLSGKGKIWIDSVRLYLDEVPIDKVPTFKAENDTAFIKGSGIDTIRVSKQNTAYLTLLGEVWGFLKYHHPAVAKGDYNWDNELFRMLPKYLKCTNDAQVSALLEQWVDGLGKVPLCPKCKPYTSKKDIAVTPDYGTIFTNTVFSKTLKDKLQYLINNHQSRFNYYVDPTYITQFTHEAQYNVAYPDAGYRLLALYRFWNIIQYYCPNRMLITEGWYNMLPQYIPDIIHANNKTAYALTVNRLIAHVHDGHAFIESLAVNQYQGIYRLPVAAHFVEGQLVVTGYYKDTLNVKQLFKIGDVITSINGVSLAELLTQNMPLMSSSNDDGKLRDLPGKCLLRSNNRQFELTLLRDKQTLKISATGAELYKIEDYDFNKSPHAKEPGYYLISKDIGYLFPAMYHNKNLDDIKATFKNTKGIIVDMRCYPSDEMNNTFGNYIKPFESPFIKFTEASLTYPGLFTYSKPSVNGKKSADNYTGKVVVIVNALAQSNAEFVTMAFQSAPNVTVIGSSSAGADGNITAIQLPGMFSTHISSIGCYYPDGTNAQRVGVKIDHIVKPTIKGIQAGRDELLEKAEQLITEN